MSHLKIRSWSPGKSALLDQVRQRTSMSHGLISTHRLSARGVSTLRSLLESQGIGSKAIPNGLYRVAHHGEPFRGSTLLIWGQTSTLVRGLGRISYQEQRYLNQGQICPSDLKVRRGLTNLKLGGNLNLLQGVVNVKPQKGFIQIMEDKILVQKGRPVSSLVSRLARVLKIPGPGIRGVIQYLKLGSLQVPTPWLDRFNTRVPIPSQPQGLLRGWIQGWTARMGHGAQLLEDKYRTPESPS